MNYNDYKIVREGRFLRVKYSKNAYLPTLFVNEIQAENAWKVFMEKRKMKGNKKNG